MLGTGAVGAIAFHLLQGLEHGLIEAVIMVGAFVLFNALLGSSKKASFAVVLIGYAFAWVGHFFFQKNKPASFIYPTFSLMGDFKMFSEILLGSVRISFAS